MLRLFILVALAFLYTSCSNAQSNKKTTMQENNAKKSYPMQLTEAQWIEKLTADQFQILRKKGTERPGTVNTSLLSERDLLFCSFAATCF